jgi:hypothetical protein
MKQLLILLFCVMMLASCSKDKENTNTSNIESLSDDLDTAELEKDEMFGAVLTNDFLGMEDEDLETYLITQIYPLVSTSKKVTIDRASASDFVVTYDEAGYTKRMLIKKYYNPLTEEVFFERSEYTKTE